jgi:hypothetical protein
VIWDSKVIQIDKIIVLVLPNQIAQRAPSEAGGQSDGAEAALTFSGHANLYFIYFLLSLGIQHN